MGRFDAPGYGRGRAGRGRHPGGRGVGFGPGCGNQGGGRGPSIASSYQLTAEQREAMLVPFLRPSPRALVPVPLEFESVRHFCDLIANNLLAEFWHLIQEGPRGPAVRATPAAGGGLRVTSGDAAGDGENAKQAEGRRGRVRGFGLSGFLNRSFVVYVVSTYFLLHYSLSSS